MVYSDYQAMKSRIGQALIAQISSKNSFFFRFRNSLAGHYLGFFNRLSLNAPTTSEYVGLCKFDQLLLIELGNGKPLRVWRRDSKDQWANEKFLGYPLLEGYSAGELQKKLPLIKTALSFHWNKSDKVHGDFTHFNILLGEKNEYYFIDQKTSFNSKIFDFFYFYSYLRQCLERCLTLGEQDTGEYVSLVEGMMLEIVQSSNTLDISSEISRMKLPDQHGIRAENVDVYRSDFSRLFK